MSQNICLRLFLPADKIADDVSVADEHVDNFVLVFGLGSLDVATESGLDSAALFVKSLKAKNNCPNISFWEPKRRSKKILQKGKS